MDHDTRLAAAKRSDSELAARLVRNIQQIEEDYFHSAWVLSEKILLEATQAIKSVVSDPWQAMETDWAVRVVCPEWKMLRGVGTGDMWLEFGELSADENGYEHSWLAAALKTAPTQLCISVAFRPGLHDAAAVALANPKATAALLKAGFVLDTTGSALIVPINIASEALAQGFQQNDIGAALKPVAKAMSLAIAAKSELDKFLELIRSTAKRG